MIRPLSLLSALVALCLLTVPAEGQAPPKVKLGIDVLAADDFAALRGMKVGLVAHPASVDGSLTPTIDVLRNAENVNLVALYGPEHGVWGDVYAGDKVEDNRDPTTGLPVFSLYGATRKPTPEMLQGIDALVFDLQDIGSRSYTFVSTMKLCLKACAEADIPFIVLDRPNPLGGERIEGPMLREGFESFIGLINTPYVHGMTMGELAQQVRDEVAPNYTKLQVIPMQGWTRDMVWADTGLGWVPTSPHIPQPSTCAAYAATGVLGELGIVSNGVGYTLPFEIVGAPNLDASFARKLQEHDVQGIAFRDARFKPFFAIFAGEVCRGVQVHIDPKAAESLYEINFLLLDALGAQESLAKNPARHAMFDKANGTDETRKWLEDGRPLAPLFARWREEAEAFRKQREPYLLYE